MSFWVSNIGIGIEMIGALSLEPKFGLDYKFCYHKILIKNIYIFKIISLLFTTLYKTPQ